MRLSTRRYQSRHRYGGFTAMRFTKQDSDARRSLEYHRTRTTEEIVESLRPGADESRKVKPDGRIFQGNTRIKVLEERGYPVNDLPRDPSHEHE
jgi:hypothetical protein